MHKARIVISAVVLGFFTFSSVTFAETYSTGSFGSGTYNNGTVLVMRDTTAPTVSITAPSAGSVSGDSVMLSANASDEVGVSGVQFKVDGTTVGIEDTTAPYSVIWNTATTVSDGNHTVTAVARDAAGNTTTSPGVVVSVTNAPPVLTATTFTLSGPTTGVINTTSTNFTITPNNIYTGTISITPSGGGLSTPIVKTFSGSAAAQTFTITPTIAGTVTLTPSNNKSLTNPAPLSYTVTASVPGAPTSVTAVAGNASAVVSFIAPSSNGGSAIISYRVTAAPGSITATGSGSPITITGLTNNTAYTFTVTAISTVGTSLASSASNTVTPFAVPPTNLPPTPSASADQNITLPTSSVTLSGSGTDSDGTIRTYTWSQVSGPTTSSIASPLSTSTVVSGLSIPGTYTFKLTVTDNLGATGTDTVIIRVNAAPIVSGGGGGGGGGSLTPTSTSNPTPIPIPGSTAEVASTAGCTGTTAFSQITGQRCPTGVTATPPVSTATNTIKVIAQLLNVRSAPSTGSIVGTVPQNTTGTIITTSGTWVKVRFDNGVEGYVLKTYTAATTSASIPTSTTATPLTTGSTAEVASTAGCTGTTAFSQITGQRCPTGTVSTTSTPPTAEQVRAKTLTTLIIRSSTSNGVIVGRVAHNTLGTVLERIASANNLSWVKVQFVNGVTGWISSLYLTPVSVSTPTTSTTTTQIVSVIPLNLNVRSLPLTGTVLGTVPQNTTGTIITTSGTWVKVRFSTGLEGWVNRTMLR